MMKLFTIALTLTLMSCAMNRQEYTGPTNCDEVRHKLQTGDTKEFKGRGAEAVLNYCVTPPGSH